MPCGGYNFGTFSYGEGMGCMRSFAIHCHNLQAEQPFLEALAGLALPVGQGIRGISGDCAALGTGIW